MSRWVWGLTGVWCACVVAGLWAMLVYASTPGDHVVASGRWPPSSGLARDPARPTLVMFVHPYCPCSRASLAELNLLATECRERFALRIVFVRPEGLPQGSEDSSLHRAAGEISGAIVSIDEHAVEAARFGATTSGETLLYAADGRLLFQGGLTWSRGHEGDNAGRAAVTSWIQTNDAPLSGTPVFGCALARRCQREETPCSNNE